MHTAGLSLPSVWHSVPIFVSTPLTGDRLNLYTYLQAWEHCEVDLIPNVIVDGLLGLGVLLAETLPAGTNSHEHLCLGDEAQSKVSEEGAQTQLHCSVQSMLLHKP